MKYVSRASSGNRFYSWSACCCLIYLCVIDTGYAKQNEDWSGCSTELIVLGTAQDAGKPQIYNWADPAWSDASLRRSATSLGLIDRVSQQRWLIDATPNIKQQLYRFHTLFPLQNDAVIQGVFLTHAHIGHYSGVMMFGRESMNSKAINVYAMPKMRDFLQNNGPWSLLVANENIVLRAISNNVPIALTNELHVTPIIVPHREEFSETVAYVISGKTRSVLFMPDIDSWEELDELGVSIEDLIAGVDVAYIDATFFSGKELPARNMQDIPHPTISHSMARFASRDASFKNRIRFLHMNHSNPALVEDSNEFKKVHALGFNTAKENETVCLTLVNP